MLASRQVRLVRLFAASPGDVTNERSKLAPVVEEFNTIHGESHGLRVELIDWRTHVSPGMGRAEQVILDQLGEFHLFIGIMWARFGTPTGEAASGTEEEFEFVYKLWQERKFGPILFYFCEAPLFLRSEEDRIQFGQVQAFRQRVEARGLVRTYANRDRFEDVVRPDLFRALIKEFGVRQAPPPAPVPPRTPEPEPVRLPLPPVPDPIPPLPKRGFRYWLLSVAVAAGLISGGTALYYQLDPVKGRVEAVPSQPPQKNLSEEAASALARAREAYFQGEYETALSECRNARNAAPSPEEANLRAQILKTVSRMPPGDRDYWRPKLKQLGEDIP